MNLQSAIDHAIQFLSNEYHLDETRPGNASEAREIVKKLKAIGTDEQQSKLLHLLSTDQQREKDILELCRQVLNASPNRYINPNGPDESTCQFCYESDIGYYNDLSGLSHAANCAYLIAKDLSTGLL